MDQSYPPSIPIPRPFASILLPILAGFSVLLCLPPLATHLKSRNTAASLLVFWITLDNLFNFINPLIWPGDDLESRWDGQALCDLEAKLNLASSTAIPGALVCILRQLAIILDSDRVTLIPSQGQRRQQLIFELIFCAACPSYMIVAHFLVQPSRYYIFAISGCVPSFDNSWPSIILMFLPPLILCTVAGGYCVLVVVRLIRYRRQFSAILAASPSNTNKSRFLRLFVLSTALVFIFLPIAIYVFVRNAQYPRHPFSWSSVHRPGWLKLIVRVPMGGVVNFDRWLNVGIGYTVFLFFAFGSDAMKMYQIWLVKILPRYGWLRRSHSQVVANRRVGSSARSSEVTKVGSIGSHPKLVFWRKPSANTISTQHTRTNSVVTFVTQGSPTGYLSSERRMEGIRHTTPHLPSTKNSSSQDGNYHEKKDIEHVAGYEDRRHNLAPETDCPVSPIEDQASHRK